MDQFFTKAITDKLPTFEHYKQLCYTLSVMGLPYSSLDISVINTIFTIKDIQAYMFNILSSSNILSAIEYIEMFKFYIAPNTYTNKLTLKQFFHCIDIKYNGYYIDTCKYKYNIFYKGSKIEDVYSHFNSYSSNSPINRQFISCHRIGLTEGTDDNNFKNLPIEHFAILLKIMGKEYVSGFASYHNEYICKYWEDKDIELYLEYVIKNRYCLESCLEKNIQKNNYTQEKLLPLYEKYLKYDNLAVQTDPLAICYTNITKILKKYIIFSIVQIKSDIESISTSVEDPNEPEIIDKIVCIAPYKINLSQKSLYTISDFIILESGKIIFRVKNRGRPLYIDDKYVEQITCIYTVYECDTNLFNKQVCINMFGNRYTGKALYNTCNKIDMVLYYDMASLPSIELDFNIEPYNKILPNKSNTDFMTTFINAENNKTHMYKLYIMSKTITKFLTLKHTNKELEEANATLQKKCDDLATMSNTYEELKEENAALKERTKILDESNF
jgi:hypothetical protein